MGDTKIRKVLEKDGIKPVRLDIPNELQSGKLGCCGPSSEPFASKVLPNLSLNYFQDVSYDELEDYLKDMQKILHEQQEYFYT